jgi:hypothetical protein
VAFLAETNQIVACIRKLRRGEFTERLDVVYRQAAADVETALRATTGLRLNYDHANPFPISAAVCELATNSVGSLSA